MPRPDSSLRYTGAPIERNSRSLRMTEGERASKTDQPLALCRLRALDQVQVIQGDAGAHRHALQRIVRHVAGDADLLGDEPVQVAQQGRAAGKNDAAIYDIPGQLS